MKPLNTKKTVVALSVLCILQRGVHAETIEVGPSCGLVDAFVSAETDSSINGCTAGSGADTITLPANSVHALTEPYDNNGNLTTALPELTSTISLQGNNSTVSRANDSSEFRLFRVVDSGDLSIYNLSASGGQRVNLDSNGDLIPNDTGGCFLVENGAKLSISDSVLSGCTSRTGGGAVASFSNSTVTIDDSTINNNYSYLGGAFVGVNSNITISRSHIERNSFHRGTILVRDSTINVLDSVISNNGEAAGGLGRYAGGISASDSTVRIVDTEIHKNTVQYQGGGIIVLGSDTTILNSTISRNFCNYRYTDSGGILIGGGNALIANATISGNIASTGFRGDTGQGGGIFMRSGAEVEILNSTIFGNRAYDGGAIFNSSSTLTLKNTIVAGETRSRDRFDQFVNRDLCFLDNANINGETDNIVEDGSCGTNALTVDPMLEERADNGGKTMTHALLAGSPAINIGNELFCANSILAGRDQRGLFHQERCDAGSFEFEGLSSLQLNGQLNGAFLLLLDDE